MTKLKAYRLPEELIEAIKDMAKKQDRTETYVVKKLLEQALKAKR